MELKVESKFAATHRLRREGRWDDAAEYKGATIEELRGEGLKRAKAQDEAWKRMIEKYPPLEFGDDVAVPTDM